MYDNEDTSCNLCDKELAQTDSHLLDCETILLHCPMFANNLDAEYEDIFGDLEKQKSIVKLFKEVFEAKLLLDEELIPSSRVN